MSDQPGWVYGKRVTLTEFLTARLDEDEATALAAATPASWEAAEQPNANDETLPGRWNVVSSEQEYGVPVAQIAQLFMEFPYGDEQTSATHIARHDPARVLREVAAKRAIVAEHLELVLTYWPQPMCNMCGDAEAESMPDPLGSTSRWTPKATFPCPTLRYLAAVYADHPDYREEWKP